jgi:protein-disulfide isomerase
MTRILSIVAAVAVLAVGGWYFMSQNGSSASAATGSADVVDRGAEFGIAEMSIGNPDAAVTVIEYASFTCPHCGTFHNGNFKLLKEEFIDTDKINFIYREVYFDRPGLWASMVARCAAPDKYFGITDLIYKDQAGWSRAGEPAQIIEQLRKIGRLAGMDDATMDACLNDAEKAENLVAWYEANAEADGIRSTPSFLINGTLHSNMAYPEMKKLIEEAMGN